MLTSDTLEAAARANPDGIAWSFNSVQRTWADADQRANRMANAFLKLGLAPQERIGLLGTNSDQFAEVFFALAKAGLIAVPLNIRSSATEIRFIAAEAGLSGFIVSADLVKVFEAADLDAGSYKALIGIGTDHGLTYDLEALMAAADPQRPDARGNDDELRIVKFTSGTTGTPKGCMGTHRECMFNVMSYLIAQPYGKRDVCGLIISLGSGLGSYLLTTHAFGQSRTVIMNTVKPGEVLDTIAAEGITRFTAVPTMIASIIAEQEARPRDLSSLELIGYTGSAATVELIARGQEVLGCGFYQSYGATESGGRITLLSPVEHAQIVDAASGGQDAWGRNVMPCGNELPGFDVRLEDDDGNQVDDGDVGELVVRGNSIFKGYWNRAELNAEVLNDGWWRSGDLARRDETGVLCIVDRKKDMIVSGGYNVYSIEVENIVSQHPDVAEVAVVGIPDPRWGEAICAFITRRPGADDGPELEDALDQLCRAELATYKAPKRYVFMDVLPKTTTGKIRKVELREAVADS
jgi:acyl-CoA synthetase (AMP-forming)/AMP-acid ligase II